MKKVIIVGGGLAGLSAGIRILEKVKDVKVTLYNMGHHLGGRATSWRDEKGFNIDHGFHAIQYGYKHFRALLKKAGVREKEVFVSNNQKSMFYEEDGKIHQFNKLLDTSAFPAPGYQYGYNSKMNKELAHFYLKNLHTFSSAKDIDKYDDECFTRWALDRGMSKSITETRFFRLTRDAYFNYPSEVSAYIVLKNNRLLKKPIVYFVNGSYGEKIIQPLVDYFQKLGGKITLYTKLLGVAHTNNKVTALQFAQIDPAPHQQGKVNWNREVPVLKQSVWEEKDFDSVVIAIPIDSFRELNKEDTYFWDYYKNIKNIDTVATLSWQLWLEKEVLPHLPCAINGLDEPMGTVINLKPIVDEYKNNTAIGSVLQWVGQETGFENHTDEQIKEIAINSFLKIPGAKDPRKAGILHDVFRRNTSNYERFYLTEPGVNKFRPTVGTCFENLFLSGDWIRNEVDVPNMEGAVKSGLEAADMLAKQLKNSR